MAKQKKKRNKIYRGTDASVTRPTITKISAANRNRIQLWWFEKKRLAKPIFTTTAIAIVVIWLILELIRVLSGGGA